MKKIFFIILIIFIFPLSLNAQQKTHKMKFGKLSKTPHYLKVAAQDTGKVTLASLEASVDMIGIGLQGVADGVHYLIAVPLEKLPVTKPLGLGVDYVYLGVDKLGEYLAK